MELPTVLPALRYDDAQAALDFLCEASGAEQHAVYRGDGGTIHHAELCFGNGIVMLGSAREGAPASGGGAIVYVVVPDRDPHPDPGPDAYAARARAAGAEITRPPYDADYGSRECSARDREGNLSFAVDALGRRGNES